MGLILPPSNLRLSCAIYNPEKIRPREMKGHCGRSARIPGNPGRYPLLEMNERRCRLGWLVQGRGRAAVRAFPAALAARAPLPPAEARTLGDTHTRLSAEGIAAPRRHKPAVLRERREPDCGLHTTPGHC